MIANISRKASSKTTIVMEYHWKLHNWGWLRVHCSPSHRTLLVKSLNFCNSTIHFFSHRVPIVFIEKNDFLVQKFADFAGNSIQTIQLDVFHCLKKNFLENMDHTPFLENMDHIHHVVFQKWWRIDGVFTLSCSTGAWWTAAWHLCWWPAGGMPSNRGQKSS